MAVQTAQPKTKGEFMTAERQNGGISCIQIVSSKFQQTSCIGCTLEMSICIVAKISMEAFFYRSGFWRLLIELPKSKGLISGPIIGVISTTELLAESHQQRHQTSLRFKWMHWMSIWDSIDGFLWKNALSILMFGSALGAYQHAGCLSGAGKGALNL